MCLLARFLAAAPLAAVLASPTAARAQAPDAVEMSFEDRIVNASPYRIAADPEMSAWVTQTAGAAIDEHCAACHGPDLTGRPGVPNLVDFDWLWGIRLEDTTSDVGPVMEIQQTILYGIRNRDCPDIEDQSYYGGCVDTRYSEMPGYRAIGVLDDEAIADMTEYVLSLGGAVADPAAVERGRADWPVCIECHGEDGSGYKPYGGPEKTDDTWLFGGDRATIADVIANGRIEQCPPYGDVLPPATIKAIAVSIWWRARGY